MARSRNRQDLQAYLNHLSEGFAGYNPGLGMASLSFAQKKEAELACLGKILLSGGVP